MIRARRSTTRRGRSTPSSSGGTRAAGIGEASENDRVHAGTLGQLLNDVERRRRGIRLAEVSQDLIQTIGPENLRAYKVRFATRVWPGDTITCQGRVTRTYEEGGERRLDGEIAAVTQKGETAVSGTFTAAVPGA